MPTKPVWPYPEVTPMTACGNGQWRRVLRGRPHYFGPLADPATALSRWFEEWPRIVAGAVRQPSARPMPTITVAEAISGFLDAQAQRLARGDISPQTLRRQALHGRALARTLGPRRPISTLTPLDFNKALTDFGTDHGLHQRHEFVILTRRVLRWVSETHGGQLIKVGSDFRVPTRAQHRREKSARGPQMLTAAEIVAMLAACPLRERGLVLLGINCGMDNSGAGALTVSDIDWTAGVLRHARKKTGQGRVAPLWPETLAALRDLIAHGYPHVFVTPRGFPLEHRGTAGVNRAIKAVMKRAGIWRPGRGYYWLRRTHATVAKRVGEDTDRRIIQGHVVDDVHEGYVQEYPIERLRTVTDHVRAWLLAATPGSLPPPWTPDAGGGEAGPPAST